MRVAAEAHESQKLERLCCCIARSVISEKPLSIAPQGKARCQLKTPWRNGTTHVWMCTVSPPSDPMFSLDSIIVRRTGRPA